MPQFEWYRGYDIHARLKAKLETGVLFSGAFRKESHAHRGRDPRLAHRARQRPGNLRRRYFKHGTDDGTELQDPGDGAPDP